MSEAKQFSKDELECLWENEAQDDRACMNALGIRRMRATLAAVEAERDAALAEVERLREVLTKVEPWAHTLNGPASLTPMARWDGTTKGLGIASMTPFAAKSPTLKHDAECPGCAARAALTPQPTSEGGKG